MKYFFANWKAYLSADASAELARNTASVSVPTDVQAAVFPSTLSFREVKSLLAGTTWQLGAQNISWAPPGAYTGETAAVFLREAGAEFVLIGHSEHRHVLDESDHGVAKKLAAAWNAGLTPILCIGETAEDAAAGKRQYRLQQQLTAVLGEEKWPANGPLIIAYEPVWAIGSGTPCTPADAEDVAGWLQLYLQKTWQRSAPILYGGSVQPQNIASYWNCASLSGVLVGTHSVQANALAELINAIS